MVQHLLHNSMTSSRVSIRLLFAASSLAFLPRVVAETSDVENTRLVRSHVSFLSDDLLEGRGTGQRGHQIAALYVAAQFSRLGLKPAGDAGTYFQHAAFIESTNLIDTSRFEMGKPGETPLSFAAPFEALVTPAPGQTKVTLTAPAVFVGYGVRALEFGHDDLTGVDLTGKIVVVLSGAPPWLPSEPRAHFTSTKLEVLATTGAIGVVTLRTPRDEHVQGWPFLLNGSRFPSMRLVDANGAIFMGMPELRIRGTLSMAASDRLLKSIGQDFGALVKAAEAKQKQTFAFEAPFTLEASATVRTIESVNVLGLLPGTDPNFAEDPIVVTAHLDHIGIGPAINGDNIYNGTMDNAMGSGELLTVAENLATAPAPRRPILFASLTGEEKGLLGGFLLSQHPPAGVKHFAGNINIDMPLFLRPTRDLIGWGGDHSTLGGTLVTVAGRQGFKVLPDPLPDETIFVRSDQYPFIRRGVPALFLGTNLDEPEKRFLKERYHKPSDDLAQPIDWDSAGAFARMATDLVGTVANAPTAPTWVPGDFFGGLFAKPQ
jgi:Zn-dependent M28 family amino/carboxypeptidase